MRKPRLIAQGPDGAVRIVSEVNFETNGRPKGWTVIGQAHAPRVTFLLAPSQGSRLLRAQWPAEALRGVGWDARYVLGWPLGGSESGDVLIIHQPIGPAPASLIDMYQQAGVQVIVSIDDEIDRIPEQNERQAPEGALEGFHAALEIADGAIVTTARLAEVYGPSARRTWQVRNYLPRWVSALERDRSVGKVVIGWAGMLSTHRQDLDWLRPVATRMVEGATFATVGDDRVPAFLGLDEFVTESFERDITAYYTKMARADVGIVPLDNGVNREFNTSKSALKTQEFLALGVPVVATDLPEHRRVLEGSGAGFLASTPDEMAAAVQLLVRDAALRAEMTAAARRHRETLTLERNVGEWTTVLEEVTDGAVRQHVGAR